MITANGIEIKPTVFPDGTSQVWKLPKALTSKSVKDIAVEWDFEAEREIIDLLSLRRLLYGHRMTLHMPYLPYGRQDKRVSNSRTFNLAVLADLLNGMRLARVTTLDAHNQLACRRLINKFENIPATSFQKEVIKAVVPDLLLYPDQGAYQRYAMNHEVRRFFQASSYHQLAMEKMRDQRTGEVTILPSTPLGYTLIKNAQNILIIDDICDGGATFIQVAGVIRAANKKAEINLFVTHGIFSKGMKVLEDAGITPRCAHLVKGKK